LPGVIKDGLEKWFAGERKTVVLPFKDIFFETFYPEMFGVGGN
jgi:hypothetical protein